jgi:hypothetical protein
MKLNKLNTSNRQRKADAHRSPSITTLEEEQGMADQATHRNEARRV